MVNYADCVPGDWSSYWDDPNDAEEVEAEIECPNCGFVDEKGLVYISRDGHCSATCFECEHDWDWYIKN